MKTINQFLVFLEIPVSMHPSKHFFWMAPTILVDGRETSTYEHASSNEILNFYKTTGI
jgi:hypothetical protein